MTKKSIKRKTAYPSKAIAIIVFSVILLFSTFIIVSQIQRSQDVRSRSQTKTDCAVSSPSELEIDNEEQKLLGLINDYRNQNLMSSLKLSSSLSRAAVWMSSDINSTKFLSHTDSLGRDISTRLENCGISNYSETGENISAKSSALSAFNAWKQSPLYNANMLKSAYQTIGVSRTKNYWVLNFSTQND